MWVCGGGVTVGRRDKERKSGANKNRRPATGRRVLFFSPPFFLMEARNKERWRGGNGGAFYFLCSRALWWPTLLLLCGSARPIPAVAAPAHRLHHTHPPGPANDATPLETRRLQAYFDAAVADSRMWGREKPDVKTPQYLYTYSILYDATLATVERKQFETIVRNAVELWNKRVLCGTNVRLVVADRTYQARPPAHPDRWRQDHYVRLASKLNVILMPAIEVSFQLGPYLDGAGKRLCAYSMNVSDNRVQGHSSYSGFLHVSSSASNPLHPLLLYYTVVHELGHSLGFGHIDDGPSRNIMYRSSPYLHDRTGDSARHERPPSTTFSAYEIARMRLHAREVRTMVFPASARALYRGWISGMCGADGRDAAGRRKKVGGSHRPAHDDPVPPEVAYVDSSMYEAFYTHNRTRFNRTAFVANSTAHARMFDTYAGLRRHYSFSGRVHNVQMLWDLLAGVRVLGFANMFGARHVLLVRLERLRRVVVKGIVMFVVFGTNTPEDGCYFSTDTSENKLWDADWTFVDDAGIPRAAKAGSSWAYAKPLRVPEVARRVRSPSAEIYDRLHARYYLVGPEADKHRPKWPGGASPQPLCQDPVPYEINGTLYGTTRDGFVITARDCVDWHAYNVAARDTSLVYKLVHMCRFTEWPRTDGRVTDWNSWSRVGPDLSRVVPLQPAYSLISPGAAPRPPREPVVIVDRWRDMYPLVDEALARQRAPRSNDDEASAETAPPVPAARPPAASTATRPRDHRARHHTTTAEPTAGPVQFFWPPGYEHFDRPHATHHVHHHHHSSTPRPPQPTPAPTFVTAAHPPVPVVSVAPPIARKRKLSDTMDALLDEEIDAVFKSLDPATISIIFLIFSSLSAGATMLGLNKYTTIFDKYKTKLPIVAGSPQK